MGEASTGGVMIRGRAKLEPVDQSYEQLLERAMAKAPRPEVFEEHEAAFWRAVVSNNELDFYGTAMMQPSLDTYVNNLVDGVSYQDSHNWGKLGLGQSIYGEQTEKPSETVDIIGEPLREVHGTFMTLRGLELGGQSTDTFLAAIQSGTWRDVSIGFWASDVRCSICGKQSFEWWKEDGCTHIPGVEYKNEKTGKMELAWGGVWDGRLLETSQVYDGATPGAQVSQVIVKANALAEERMLDPGTIRAVEHRYQTRLRQPVSQFPVTSQMGDASISYGAAGTNGAGTWVSPDGYQYRLVATTGGSSVTINGEGSDMARKAKGQGEVADRAAIEARLRASGVAVAGEDGDTITLEAIDEDGQRLLDEQGRATVVLEVEDEAVTLSADEDDEGEDEIDEDTEIEAIADEDAEDEEEGDDAGDGDEGDDDAERAARAAAPVEDVLAGERARLAPHGIKLGKNPVMAVRKLGDALVELRRQNAELAKDADLGKRYRKDVVGQAIAEGVRAHGANFKQEQFRAMLETLTVEQVELQRDAWKEIAERALRQGPDLRSADGFREPSVDELNTRRHKRGAHKA